MNVISLPEMMKSITGNEAIGECSCRAFRGERGERASKEWSRYLGDPRWQENPLQDDTGNNNRVVRCRRESERLTVAGKSGKLDGAKEPCLRHAESEERRAA
jgi:hypothetical protein